MKEDADLNQISITLHQLTTSHQRLSELLETNINLRMKYPTQPLKFFQSEEEIDTILQELQQLNHQHLSIIVSSSILQSIIKLINHPNVDINSSCIELLHELITQEPTDDEIYEIYYRTVIWLIENGLCEGIVEVLEKMNEEENVEEYEISLKILKILQSLIELWEDSVKTLVEQTKILEYLSNRIMPNYKVNHKTIDDNKYVSSDLLVLILQNSERAQVLFHKLCGMQILIESMKPFEDKVPSDSNEKEYLNNLFNCVNILLINPMAVIKQSKKIYHSMNSNQLMIHFLKNKNEYSVNALKAISNSFNLNDADDQTKVAQDLVNFGALKYIFIIIHRQGVKGEDIDEQKIIDENALNIIYNLIKSTTQIFKTRVQSKLSEKRYAKLERMFEMRIEYMQNLGRESETPLTSSEYLQKLKEGLNIVEIIDKIISTLAISNTSIRQKIAVFLNLYSVSVKQIEQNLNNLYKYLNENSQKQWVGLLISQNLIILKELVGKRDSQKDQ